MAWKYQSKSLDDVKFYLALAAKGKQISSDSQRMMEGVLRISHLTAREVMVAAPKMEMIPSKATVEDCFAVMIEVGHSRYPVYEDDKSNIIGLLHAKDILKLQRSPDLSLRSLMRPAMFMPESKRLTDLLREFKRSRTHMAILVDEFGRVSGLVTIEDVLEEIVGEIEDEFDKAEASTDIFSFSDNSYRVAGHADIESLNEHFEVSLPQVLDDERFDTIGGLIAHLVGHVPRKGERHDLEGLSFTVMHVKGGAVTWFRVRKQDPIEAPESP